MQHQRFIASRRAFIRNTLFASGVLALPPWISGCAGDSSRDAKDFEQDLLSEEHWNNLRIIQDILLPNDEYGPGALDVLADRYFIWVLQGHFLYPDDEKALFDGFEHFNSFMKEEGVVDFAEMDRSGQEMVVAEYATNSKGKFWLGKILLLCFEAMFADPVYGCNPDGIGYQWINYTPGAPRPTAQTRFPEILEQIYEV